MGAQIHKVTKPTNPILKSTLVSENTSHKLYRSESGQFYEVHRIQNYGFKDFLDKFQHRIINQHQNVVNAYFLQEVKNNFGCIVEGIYDIVIDGIRSRLCEETRLGNGVSINVFRGALKGFQILYSWVGLFEVKDTMIGFSYNNTVKVWLNSKFQLNSLENQPIIYQNVLQNDKQSVMMNNILQLINSKSQKQQIWVNFVRWWRQNNFKSFKTAICMIEDYIDANNISKSLVYVNQKDNKTSMYTVANNNLLKQSNVVKQTTNAVNSDLTNSVITKSKDNLQLKSNQGVQVSQSQQIKPVGFSHIRAKAIHHHTTQPQFQPQHANIQLQNQNQQRLQHKTQTRQQLQSQLHLTSQPMTPQFLAIPPYLDHRHANRFVGSTNPHLVPNANNNGTFIKNLPQMPMILRAKQQRTKFEELNINQLKMRPSPLSFNAGNINLVNSVSLDDRRFVTQNRSKSINEKNAPLVSSNPIRYQQVNKPILSGLISPPKLITSIQTLHKFPEPRRAAQIVQNIKNSPNKNEKMLQSSKNDNNLQTKQEKLIKLNQAIKQDSTLFLTQSSKRQITKDNARIPGKIKHKTGENLVESKREVPIKIQSNLQIFNSQQAAQPQQVKLFQEQTPKKTSNNNLGLLREASMQKNGLTHTPSFKTIGQPSLQFRRQLKLAQKTQEQMQKSRHRMLSLQNNLTNSMKMLDSIEKKMEMSKISRMSRTSSDLNSSLSYKDLNNLLKTVRRTKND